MPAQQGRDEEVLIRLFVSAYENFAWAGSKIEYPDTKRDGAVDGLVERPDGKTMVIEHTLIEPFVGDKRDYSMFEKKFLKIENDKSLAVPDTATIVYVPVGILDGVKPAKRNVIVKSIHSWIANNRLHLREGKHEYQCDIPKMPSVTLTVKRNKFRLARPGIVLVRRQQVTNDLHKVIENALRMKLPKIVNTNGDRHVLFLERDQFTFFPELIFAEIEHQRTSFPLLEKIDEIWHVETIFYKQGGYVDFELWRGGQVLATMAFQNSVLTEHSKGGRAYPM